MSASVKKTGQWGPLGQLLARGANPLVWRQAKERAIVKEAHRLRRIIIEGFNSGGPSGARWPRLKPITQLISRAHGKGDRKPLMDSGDLRNSIAVTQEKDGWFVGVHKKAQGRKGKRKMVDIAAVHENGTKRYTIAVTPKMRGYFIWLSKATKGQIKPLKASTTHITVQIPARPFIGPVWEKEKDASARNISVDTIKNLGLPGVSGLL